MNNKSIYRCLEVVGDAEIVTSLNQGQNLVVVRVYYFAAAGIYDVDALCLF